MFGFFRPARKTIRPIRPKPLIPTLIAMLIIPPNSSFWELYGYIINHSIPFLQEQFVKSVSYFFVFFHNILCKLYSYDVIIIISWHIFGQLCITLLIIMQDKNKLKRCFICQISQISSFLS